MLADHNEYEIISLEMINGLVFACLKKQSDVPFMSDRQTLLAHIVRKSGGIVYQGINESALQRIYRFPKRFVKRCLRWVT